MLKPAAMLRLVFLAVVHSSCAERVDVGSADKAIDLGACLGADAQCGRRDGPRFTADRSDRQTVSRCETREDDSWHLDWWLPLDAVPCAPLGFCSPWSTAIAADGSVWLAGIGMTSVDGADESSLGGIFVAHYDAQGELVAKRVRETARFDRTMPNMRVAIAAQDGTGAVVVAVLDGETWVQRLDAQVNNAGPRVALIGVDEVTAVDVSMHASGGVYVSAGGSLFGENGPTALAMLDAELDPVWIQGTALHNARFVPTRSDELLLMGMTQAVDATATFGHYVLVSYDGRGNAARELDIPDGYERLSIGEDGKIMILTQSITYPYPYEAIELAPEGDVLEHVEVGDMGISPSVPLEGNLALVSTTTDRDGNSYFAHFSGTTEGFQGMAIVQRNATDGRCTKSVVAVEADTDVLSFAEIPKSQLWWSDDGALYVRFDEGMVRLSR
jgi:hypothetical protein